MFRNSRGWIHTILTNMYMASTRLILLPILNWRATPAIGTLYRSMDSWRGWRVASSLRSANFINRPSTAQGKPSLTKWSAHGAFSYRRYKNMSGRLPKRSPKRNPKKRPNLPARTREKKKVIKKKSIKRHVDYVVWLCCMFQNHRRFARQVTRYIYPWIADIVI